MCPRVRGERARRATGGSGSVGGGGCERRAVVVIVEERGSASRILSRPIAFLFIRVVFAFFLFAGPVRR